MVRRVLAGRVPALLLAGVVSVAAGVLAARVAASFAAPSFHGTPYPDTPPAPTFTLTSHEGHPTSLEAYRGRAVLLFFGFTRCPSFCPLTLAKLNRVLADEGIGPNEAIVMLVTVDPEYDTPDRIAEYLQPYGDRVVGLTGDTETLASIFAEYGVYSEPTTNHDGHETIAHTSVVFGIDREGRLVGLLHPEEPDDIVASDIRYVLAAGR